MVVHLTGQATADLRDAHLGAKGAAETALDEAGEPTRELMLVDEVLTPDSSRYWPLAGYAPGRDQPSFDKQYLRNWLLAEVAAGRWRKEPPGPALPPEVVEETRGKYEEAARLLA